MTYALHNGFLRGFNWGTIYIFEEIILTQIMHYIVATFKNIWWIVGWSKTYF
jgi:hypothetical protein